MRRQRMSRLHPIFRISFPLPLDICIPVHIHQHDQQPRGRRPHTPHFCRHDHNQRIWHEHGGSGHRVSLSDGLLPVLGLLQRRLLSCGAGLRRHILSDGPVIVRGE